MYCKSIQLELAMYVALYADKLTVATPGWDKY